MSIALTLKSYIFSKNSSFNSSEHIMRRYVATGNQTLLAKLYETNGDDLYHFVLTLSEPTLAKDICQKTWLKVIEKKHLYQNTGQFKAWLFTIARNQLMDEYRANRFITNNTDSCVAPLNQKHGENQQAHGQLNQDVALCFDRALLNLAFEQREAFCLQQEGFALTDIASITHTNQETVKSRLRYAKDNLRKQLAMFHGENHD